MRRETFCSALCIAMLLGGCPHRQTTPGLVYVPSSPPASSAPAEAPQSVVIEEPPPPEAPAPAAQPVASPPKPVPRRQASRPDQPATEPLIETVEPPPAEVPALEPHETPAQQAELHRQVMDFQGRILERIHTQQARRQTGANRRTLQDAIIFMRQSARALEAGDLQRAMNLARKASLLLEALEQKP